MKKREVVKVVTIGSTSERANYITRHQVMESSVMSRELHMFSVLSDPGHILQAEWTETLSLSSALQHTAAHLGQEIVRVCCAQ